MLDKAPTDVYILNSCTVTATADRKARHALALARRRAPNALIVASGCYAERDKATLQSLNLADIVAGNREKENLTDKIAEFIDPSPGLLVEPMLKRYGENESLLGRSRAAVKIQEGCNQVCAYCIVPKVRGRERSIPPGEIVAQIQSLHENGCLEVVLTGTQLGSYGFDMQGWNLTNMLKFMLADTSIPRIRVSSLQPLEINDELLSLWTRMGAGRLCPHFHIPLQSGSDTILQRMRRRYTVSRFEEAVELVRERVPDCSITTDVIVGFPGETQEDYNSTLQLMERVAFASTHVFPYSTRPGTTAAHFKSDISETDKKYRVKEAHEKAFRLALKYRLDLVGKTRPVLWEKGTRRGLTDNYVRVRAASSVEGDCTSFIQPAKLSIVEPDLTVVCQLASRSVPGQV